MTTPETVDLVRFLLAAYPTHRRNLSGEDAKAMVAAYQAGLEDVEISVVQQAAKRLIRTSKFLPSVAEIREAIGVVHSGERRHGVDAWGDVAKLLAFADRGDVDPLVLQICRAFGWVEWRTLFRNGDEVQQWHVVHGENESADRARFIEAYDKLASDARRRVQASDGATAKTLPAAAQEAVAQLESLSGKLSETLGSNR